MSKSSIIKLFLISSISYFLFPISYFHPTPVFADTLISDCARKDCDTVNFTPGHLVCIETWQKDDGSTYEKPGFDTEVSCTSSSCVCSPGAIKYDCYKTIPDGWCQDSSQPGNYGRGAKLVCSQDCTAWVQEEVACYSSCVPPEPQVTPMHYSMEKSVGETNELLEGKILSGTRDVPIDDSDINNYGPLSVLMPGGGIDNELKVNFVKDYGDYKVTLWDGNKMKATDIWNKCTDNGDLNNRQDHFDKLEDCREWGFVPNTHRRLETVPPPKMQTKEVYFTERESPFVQSWTFSGFLIPLDWIVKLFQSIFCIGGLFCPPDNSLPLKNPDDLTDWTKGKPNIPAETTSNAQLLRQFLFPEGLGLASAPSGDQSYFDTWHTDPQTVEVLNEVGQAAQYTAAEGGLFWMFQPEGLENKEKCQENTFNPQGGCASDFYFKLNNASPNACDQNNVCYVDTPDQETEGEERFTDDRPLVVRQGVDAVENSLFPEGL